MDFDITIGSYRLALLDSVEVKRSVANLADTAVIKLPGTVCNQALEIEDRIREGDPVCIRFGYDAEWNELPVEFEGYVTAVSADDGSIKVECEDAIYLFRRDLKNAVLKNVSAGDLLRHVLDEVGDFDLACDYDFRYDKFAIYETTAFDVLKKVQEETHANVYLRGRTLHLHPQYAEVGARAIFDFAANIEKSDLKYRDDTGRKRLVTVEGTDARGRTVKVTRGTPGGDKFTLKLPGVSDAETLGRRADEELKIRGYAGYEGSFTAWLVPFVAPADAVELRDADYEYKRGVYYVVSVETTFSSAGGSRKITLGKKIR